MINVDLVFNEQFKGQQQNHIHASERLATADIRRSPLCELNS